MAGDATYQDFLEQMTRAKARWAVNKVREVQDPRWLLERSDPETFGKPEAAPVQVNVAQTVATDRLEEATVKVIEILRHRAALGRGE